MGARSDLCLKSSSVSVVVSIISLLSFWVRIVLDCDIYHGRKIKVKLKRNKSYFFRKLVSKNIKGCMLGLRCS